MLSTEGRASQAKLQYAGFTFLKRSVSSRVE